MIRFHQTIARIAAGIVTGLMLCWFLWPRDATFLEREESLFAFVVAFIFWILSEIKESDEVVFRASTKNDIRICREIVSYSTQIFKTLLNDHDYHRGLQPRYLSEANTLIHEMKVGIVIIQDKKLVRSFKDFQTALEAFSNYFSMHSSPEKIGPRILQSIVPSENYHDHELPRQLHEEIDEANLLATEAWKSLRKLLEKIRARVPEAFDEEIEYRWFRTENQLYNYAESDQ